MPMLRIKINGETRLLENFTRERAGVIAAGIMKNWLRLTELGDVVMTAEEGNVIELLDWEIKHDSHHAS